MLDATPLDGSSPIAQQQVDLQKAAEEMCYANYRQIGAQLGAVNTLLGPMPLQALLAACKRHQATMALTAPAGVTGEQIAAAHKGLLSDERVITAALNLQRVVAAVNSGQE